jgi:hypothetical protein
MGRLSSGVKMAARPAAVTASPSVVCDANCPAAARVHVIRPPDYELAFCEHHFRKYQRALTASGWLW